MKKSKISFMIVFSYVLLMTVSCHKDEDQTGPIPVVYTLEINNYCGTTAYVQGEITNDNGCAVTGRGVCWSTHSDPTVKDDTILASPGEGEFTCFLTGLTPKTLYYVRAYATNSNGTGYGNTMSFTTNHITVGEEYQGGIVAYILYEFEKGYVEGETHGCIVAPSDQSTGAPWGCMGTLIGCSTGDGNTCTEMIVNKCSTLGIAAKLCNDLVLNGYDDWYLPNVDQLYRGGIINPSDEYYWSSTEINENKAEYAIVGNASYDPYFDNKDDLHPVRAYRNF